MTARDLILDRLHAALGTTAAPPETPRRYRGPAGPGDLALLTERLTDYRATVHRCPPDGIATVLDDLLAGKTAVVPPGLPGHWLPSGVTVLRDDGRLAPSDIGGADAMVTGAALAVALIGAIVLDGSPDQGRRILTLLPDVHVCVVRTDQVVASVPDAIARLDPRRPLTWISGPSATSDIEFERVEGVHGPRTLHVVLAG